MNARAIAEEVTTWYQSQVDPWRPHAANVRRHLNGPVLTLTHGILMTGRDSSEHQQAIPPDSKEDDQEEKKCCVADTTTSSSSKCQKENGPLDKSLWGLSSDSKAMDDLYHSLGRRHRARLDAFLTGVEIAAPTSDIDKISPTGSMGSLESLPEEDDNDNKSVTPPSTPPRRPLNNNNATTTTTTPGRASLPSPVLTSLNNHGKALVRAVSNSEEGLQQPQIRKQELRIRLELYIRSLYRSKSLQRPCVIAAEPDRAIKARAEMIVSAFVSTVGCVRGVGPVLLKLLVNVTKELLAVEFVAEDLYRVIRRIVNEYEHSTSFASLAFLSSPEASAESRLIPLVLKYIRYIQSDWKTNVSACELERMLSSSLDGNMRRYLKTVEFQSIGHLLEVCNGFRNELQSIELTPSNSNNNSSCFFGTGMMNNKDLCENPEAVRQAIRDLQREVITVNGHVLPPVNSHRGLVAMLSQSLNSSTLTARSNNKHNQQQRDVSPPLQRKTESCPSLISFTTQPSGSTDESLDSNNNNNNSSSPRKKSPQQQNRKAAFHAGTVDLLTRRLLIAASRTGTGGDAYFIVRDLFGDEDVEVVPAKVLPHHVRATRVGSIEIQVRLASVTIKCHGSFDIYPKSLVGTCEPLIQLHTTSSETIYLQELRPGDGSSQDGKHQCFEDDGSRSSDGMEALVLQEKRTNKTGRRILSIRPALYEKVQVWNTPS